MSLLAATALRTPSGSYIGTRLPALPRIADELRELSACVRLSLPVFVLIGSQIGSQRVRPKAWQSRRFQWASDVIAALRTLVLHPEWKRPTLPPPGAGGRW
jgi:hypothetical protein